MIALEDVLLEELPTDLGYVDGHDCGSGETNIFIHTDHPQKAFTEVRAIPEVSALMPQLRVAYRKFDGNDWKILHPEGLSRFAVI